MLGKVTVLDERVWPYQPKKLIFAKQLAFVLEQDQEKVGRFGCQRNAFVRTIEQPCLGIKVKRTEFVGTAHYSKVLNIVSLPGIVTGGVPS